MYIDKKIGLEYVGEIESIYHKLCLAFLKKYENFEEELSKTEDHFVLIHNLKAISLNIGAIKLYELIKDNYYEDYDIFIDTFKKTYAELTSSLDVQ